jgi:adenosylmethionine-8-amino-7-oxononanoate aminotransferase
MSPCAISTDRGPPGKVFDTTPGGYLMDRDLNTAPHEVTNARGNYIHLDNGQMIFDATGGAAVACLGHGNEEVIEAVTNQMLQISYCHSMFFGTRCTSSLAEELIAGTNDKLDKAFIICSGLFSEGSLVRRCELIHVTYQGLRLWKPP